MNLKVNTRLAACMFVLFLGLGGTVRALSPDEVVVVISKNSLKSQEVGHYYAQSWDIPGRNIIYVDWPTNRMGDGTSVPTGGEVHSKLKVPIDAAIAGLGTEINAIVLSWDLPYSMSTNSGLYGVQGYLSSGGISGANQYYNRLGTAYRSSAQGNQRMVFHLFGYDVKLIKAMIDRGVAGDQSRPAGTIYFQPCDGWTDLGSGSSPQGFRYPNSRTIAPELVAMGVNASRTNTTYNDENFAPNAHDIIGLLTGYGVSYTPIKNHLYTQISFRPGAIADHVTSGGGRIDCWTDSWHLNMNEWISLGATATYGTMAEPGATQARFPHPRMYLAFTHGACIGETYYSGLSYPDLSVFIGDPLCAPYAVRPSVSCSLADGAAFAGLQNVSISAVTARRGAGIGRIRVLVDDAPLQTLSVPLYRAGDQVTLTFGSATKTYTVPSGASQNSIISDLAALVNNDSSLPFTATTSAAEFPGALTLRNKSTAVSTPYGVTAAGQLQAMSVGNSTFAGLANGNPEMMSISFYGTPSTSDVVEVIITLGNGDEVKFSLKGSSVDTFRNSLVNAVNNNTRLKAVDGVSAETYSTYYVKLIARDVSQGHKLLARVNYGTAAIGAFQVSPTSQGTIGFVYLPLVGDRLALSVYLPDGTRRDVSATASGTNQFEFARAVADAIRADAVLAGTNGVVVSCGTNSSVGSSIKLSGKLNHGTYGVEGQLTKQPGSTLAVNGISTLAQFNKPSAFSVSSNAVAGLGRVFISPGATSRTENITLDGAAIGEGWHRMRIVVEDSSILAISRSITSDFCVSSARIPVIRCANGDALPGACTSDAPVTVKISESFSSLEIFADGNLLGRINGAGPYMTNLNLSVYSQGSIDLQAVGTDAAGKKVRGPIQRTAIWKQTKILNVWPQAGSGLRDAAWIAFENAVNTNTANLARLKIMCNGVEAPTIRRVDTDNRVVRLEPVSALPAGECLLVVSPDFVDQAGNPVQAITHRWTPVNDATLIFSPRVGGVWQTRNIAAYSLSVVGLLRPEWSEGNGIMQYNGVTTQGEWADVRSGPYWVQGPANAPLEWSKYFQAVPYNSWTKFDASARITPKTMDKGGWYGNADVDNCGVKLAVGPNALIARSTGNGWQSFHELLFYTAKGLIKTQRFTYVNGTPLTLRLISDGTNITASVNGLKFASSAENVQGGTLQLVAKKTGACEFSNVSVLVPGVRPDPVIDNDNDGVGDAWEIANFGSTNSAAGVAGADADHDGMSNAAEFMAGTDPNNAASVFRVTDLAVVTNEQFTISWPSVAGRTYRVQRATNLLSGFVETLAWGIPATPPENTHAADMRADGGFVRVVVE